MEIINKEHISRQNDLNSHLQTRIYELKANEFTLKASVLVPASRPRESQQQGRNREDDYGIVRGVYESTIRTPINDNSYGLMDRAYGQEDRSRSERPVTNARQPTGLTKTISSYELNQNPFVARPRNPNDNDYRN